MSDILQYGYQKKIEEFLSTGRKKSYFVAAVTVFFILLMSFVGIIPALSSLGIQHEENFKRDQIIQKLETKLDTLKEFVRESQEKKNVINYLNYIFPEEFPEKYTLDKLVSLAQENAVEVNGYEFKYADIIKLEEVHVYASQNTKSLTVDFVGESSLSNLQSFVQSLESSSRIFNIQDIAITKIIGDEANNIEEGRDFNFTISLEVYYYSPTETKL